MVGVAGREPTTGKVIAELRFAFWERMLNASHQQRLWDARLVSAFPHLDTSHGLSSAREQLRQKVFVVRDLRNRIAHHEPISYRATLQQDFETIIAIIEARCPISADWITRLQNVSEMIAAKP